MTTDRDSRGLEVTRWLEHGPWVRALAARLVGGGDGPEDLVQDTWVAALEARPREVRSVRAWLSGVTRHLASRRRRDARTRERHETRRPPAPAPPAAELVERVEVQRRIAEAVLALEEPYRETVIRRFFDGARPAGIARLQGIPESTVRTRLRRALAKLRERLDRDHGSRAAWCAALGAFRLEPSPAAEPLAVPGAAEAAGSSISAATPWSVFVAASVVVTAVIAVIAVATRIDGPVPGAPDAARATGPAAERSPVGAGAPHDAAIDTPRPGPRRSRRPACERGGVPRRSRGGGARARHRRAPDRRCAPRSGARGRDAPGAQRPGRTVRDGRAAARGSAGAPGRVRAILHRRGAGRSPGAWRVA